MPSSYGVGGTQSAPGERLAWKTVEAWIEAARNYWICTTRADGRPHAKPVWGVWLDRALLFSTDGRSLTGRNLARDPEAVIHTESGDDVAILEGPVEPLPGGDLLDRLRDRYESKYGYRLEPGDQDTPVLALRPRSVLSWTESDFPETATRWRL
jgi:hypothetical protein